MSHHTGTVACSGVEFVPGSTGTLKVPHDVLTLSIYAQVVEHIALINVYTAHDRPPTHVYSVLYKKITNYISKYVVLQILFQTALQNVKHKIHSAKVIKILNTFTATRNSLPPHMMDMSMSLFNFRKLLKTLLFH